MQTNLRRRLLASTILIGATLAATPAFAQEKAAENTETVGTEIIVTGSRIVRPDLETSSPTLSIGADEINFRQATTAEDLLRDLPGLRPNIGSAVNNGSNGASYIDLRGIGVERTLTLLDGRRIVPFGLDNVTDTNVIPIQLIERVDVVTGGASTVYGADAVAGVVNFITKKDFQGIDLSANYRIADRGDARRWRADLLMGANIADGRGNVVLGIGYIKQDPLAHTRRSIAAFPISSTTGLFLGSQGSVPTIFTSPGNSALGIAASTQGAALDPVAGILRPALDADTYNTNNGTYFQTPLDKFNVYGSAHFEYADGHEIYATGMFTRSNVRLQLAPSATFNNTFRMPLNNPFLPVGVRNQLCLANSISAADCATAAAVIGGVGATGYREVPVIAQRRFVELGFRGQEVVSQQFQVEGGLRGNITSNIKYDLFGSYGETTQNQTRQNWGSFSKFQQALRSFRNASGQVVCADTSNGCVPVNLFGPAGSITPAMYNFFTLDAQIRRVTRLSVINGLVSGDLFTLPFADKPIAFAVGGEYRRISARSFPDTPSQIQGEVLGTGARTPPDVGAFSVKEAFGELIVPLVQDKPFFQDLTLEAGIRFSDYTTTGSSTTWKAGGSWTPLHGFKFRGMYQVAVRSPNVQELFQGQVQGLSNQQVDPCQGSLPVGNAALTALCVATGAPASVIGNIPTPSSNQINATTQGNPNLDVERASTYTLGGVIQPDFVPGLSLTVDYFNIKVNNAITQPAQGDILNGCFSTAQNPTLTFNNFCALVGRNPLNGSLNGAGETLGVVLSYSNLGRIRTAGWDFGFNYRRPLSAIGMSDASITLSYNATLVDKWTFQANPLAITRNCLGYYSTNCTNPRAKFRSNGRLTFSKGGFDLSFLWTHVSAVALEPPAPSPRPANNVPQTGGPNPATVLEGFRRIGSYDLFDLSARVMVTDHLELTLTVDNLFDRKPPLVGAGVGGTAFNSGNTFPTIYDAIGRAYTVGARFRF